MFTSIHPSNHEDEKRTKPYYKASKAPGSAYSFPEIANQSIEGLQEFDACEDVFVCLAHDPALFEVLPLINDGGKSINSWKEKGWKEKTRWMFLNEMPREGRPGRDPLVFGFWRDGKCVGVEEALKRD